jgi:hypothetical protein
MHSLSGRPHRVKHLRLLSPEVNNGKEPMGIIIIYGDDDLVQSEDILLRGPSADIVVGVGSVFHQPSVEIGVGYPAFGLTD